MLLCHEPFGLAMSSSTNLTTSAWSFAAEAKSFAAANEHIFAKCSGMTFCEVPMQPEKMPVASAGRTCSSAPAKKTTSLSSRFLRA